MAAPRFIPRFMWRWLTAGSMAMPKKRATNSMLSRLRAWVAMISRAVTSNTTITTRQMILRTIGITQSGAEQSAQRVRPRSARKRVTEGRFWLRRTVRVDFVHENLPIVRDYCCSLEDYEPLFVCFTSPDLGVGCGGQSSRRVSDRGGGSRRSAWGPRSSQILAFPTAQRGHHPRQRMMAPLQSGGGLNHDLFVPNEARYQAAPTPHSYWGYRPLVRPRQQVQHRGFRRTGQPDRCIRIGSKPGAHVQRGALVGGQPLGPPSVDVAVGDQRAVTGNAHLTAVGVPGDDQVRAVGRHGVQHARVRGMGDCQPQGRIGVEIPGHFVIAVQLDVRVIHATHVDPVAGDGGFSHGIVQSLPSGVQQF